MEHVDINHFTRSAECIYKGERYSVRDNGAVFRHPQIGKRIRPNDKQWTFGKTNSSNLYLHLANTRIHRIVATAFHGEPPNPQYVVDHIDTNCRNNRPENLRWVTRLENALMNPITRARIEFICGSIEAFLENPSILHGHKFAPNFSWMRTVTEEEAQNCKQRMSIWAENIDKTTHGGSLGEWVYEPITETEKPTRKAPSLPFPDTNHEGHVCCAPQTNDESDLVMALTTMCVQYKWRVPSYFPCCPKVIGESPLDSYFQNLKVGGVLNYNDVYPQSTILKFVKIKNNPSILVMCGKEGLKPWSLAEITFESDLFIHANLGSFFTKDGAEKRFCIKQGLEWTGGDTFDDFC